MEKFYLGLTTCSNYEEFFEWVALLKMVQQWKKNADKVEDLSFAVPLVKRSTRNLHETVESSESSTGNNFFLLNLSCFMC